MIGTGKGKGYGKRGLGLMAYNVSTVGGFSGSPVLATRNGTQRIVAMHVCGNLFRRNCNYGISTRILQHFLKNKNYLPNIEKEDLLESFGAGTSADLGISQ